MTTEKKLNRNGLEIALTLPVDVFSMIRMLNVGKFMFRVGQRGVMPIHFFMG